MDRQYNSQPVPMRNTHNNNGMNNRYQPHNNQQGRMNQGYQVGGNSNGGMNKGNPHQRPPNNSRSPNQQSMSSNAPQCAQNDEPKRYMNIKSHGKSNAIEFAPDNTQKGWDTLRIEAAPKLGGNTKAYDWANKVSVQVTKTELPVVVAVLLGFLPSCEFKNHGDTAKWFSIENQGKAFYIKVGQASDQRMLPCPVPFVEAHLAGMVALSQYAKNFEGMSTDAALEAIKVMSSHMIKNESFPKARQVNNRR